jgi:hypothetical protein
MTNSKEMTKGLAAASKGIAPKVVKISEELSCELNDVEWNNRARELAEAHKEVARQEERKKTVSSGLANDVKIAKAKESKLADVVATREEQREVTVEVKYDYELGTVSKTRTDTGEVISDREMTDDERQVELELHDANDVIEARHIEAPVATDDKDEDTEDFSEGDLPADTDEDKAKDEDDDGWGELEDDDDDESTN